MAPTYEQLQAEVLSLRAQLGEQRTTIAQLEVQVQWLRKQLFGGAKSEKLNREQLLLELDQAEAALEQAKRVQQVSYEREVSPEPAPAARGRAAEAIEHLPVKETTVIEPEEVKAEPGAYEKIGEEVTHEVDITPPQLFRRAIVRTKYRRRDDASRPPLVAPAPARPVQGGHASAGLLAWVVTAKYLDHLPLYRQERMFERQGLRVSRQSMNEWVRLTAEWLEPLHRLMHQRLLQGGYVQMDETPVRCNDPDEKDARTQTGYLWALGRPGGDVVFHWRTNRQHGNVPDLLGSFRGVLHSDGYEAYAAHVRTSKDIVHAACWAHARRKIFEAKEQDPLRAAAVLEAIAAVYHQEGLWDDQMIEHGPQRAALRAAHLAPLLQRVHDAVDDLRGRALPKSPLGEASAYILERWHQLCALVHHGEARLDTNSVENAIRPSALGKKNWLFIGHPDAGQRTAILYSILVSCLRHGVKPLDYLRDVLRRLPALTNRDDLTPLLPSQWKPTTA